MMTTARAKHSFETNVLSTSCPQTRAQSEGAKAAAHWCESCGAAVGMIAAEKAAILCQCTRRQIYRWIEAGEIHFTELLDGSVWVCGKSLAQKIDELDANTNKLES
ncbi:MAG: hypothetical protein JNJ50_17350 [Acidobacteria bacterium]|nr:hypothetical protein [Acidobacteriota bacterium]